MIYVNQGLTIKGGSTSGGTTTPAPSTGNTSSSTYTVKSGDTLWSISQRYGTTVQAIQSLNGMTNAKLSPGMNLRVQ